MKLNLFCLYFQRNSPKQELTGMNKTLLDNSINIYIDVQTLLERLPSFQNLAESRIPIENKDILRHSLKPSETTLQGTKVKVRECIVHELYDNFNVQLKQVSDIPRLYRKTNRSVPTKPCAYIDTITKALKDFNEDVIKRLDNAFLIELYEALFNVMTVS